MLSLWLLVLPFVTTQVHGLGLSTLRSFATAEDGRPSGFDPTSKGSRLVRLYLAGSRLEVDE